MQNLPSGSAPFRRLFVALSLMSPLLLASCESCKRAQSFKESAPKAGLIEGMSLEKLAINDINKYLPDACRENHNKAFPAIYAHYLAQTFVQGTLLEDILVNDIGKLECAPGPFLFERDNEIDAPSKRWHLKGMPNYFVLHLDSSKFSDESFYIASQNGFPLHCQYYKLQQNESATLVLLPKTRMLPNEVYFLYLILNEGDSRRTWIQPLTAMEG